MRFSLRSRLSTLVLSLAPVVACGGPLDENGAPLDDLPLGVADAERGLPGIDDEGGSSGALAKPDRSGGGGGTATTGNGAPSGSHYTLNIIGKARDKTADMTGNNGHRIFVDLNGRTRINLREGADFQVIDANGTDGSASFELPNPDSENDGVTAYSVYARALGTPGGSSTTTPCATEVISGEEYCSSESMVLVRSRGNNKFQNVSKELLYLYLDLDGDGATERYPLFSDELQDYLWQYDNTGLRIAQLRFYPVATDVN